MCGLKLRMPLADVCEQMNIYNFSLNFFMYIINKYIVWFLVQFEKTYTRGFFKDFIGYRQMELSIGQIGKKHFNVETIRL